MENMRHRFLSGEDEILPGGKIGVDYASGNILFVDKGFSALTGYTFEELKARGASWTRAFLLQEEEASLKRALTDVCTLKRASAHARIICKSGATVWADVYVGLVEDKQNGDYVVLMFMDNTKRYIELKNAENTRREMDVLIANLPGGVAKVMIESDFKIIFASDGFYKLTGYTREEYHSYPISGCGTELILLEDREKVLKNVARQMQSGEPLFAEYRIRRKDGEIVWIQAHGSPVETINDIPIAQVIFTDTTAVKSGARKLISLSNSIPGGIARLRLSDTGISVEYTSDGFYELIGYSKDEFKSLGLRFNCAPLFFSKEWHPFLNSVKEFFDKDNASCEPVYEYECRIKTSFDEVRWINIRGRKHEDSAVCCEMECVFTDVTERINSREALRQSEMKYRFMSEHMNEVVLEWHIKTGDVFLSGMFKRRFGYNLNEKNTITDLKRNDVIHESDKDAFVNIIKDIKGGAESSETELRIKHISGKYLWCGVKLLNVFDDEGNPDKAFGIIYDIERYKRKTAELAEKAERDPLTNIYNKAATRDYTCALITDRPHDGAMFILDLDDFKGVNDAYGHSMGDEVLLEFTRRIKTLVRSTDVFGRVGGDEFLVYISRGMSASAAKARAQTFVDCMRCPVEFKGVECQVNVSVGYAVCPFSGETYEALFDHADKALYSAKQSGRNRAIG